MKFDINKRCFRYKDLTGLKFNKWTVIEEDFENKKDRFIRWKVICECGKIHSIITNTLTSGKSKGCRVCSLRLPKGESAFNRVLENYKRNAKGRGIEWGLSKEQFRYLTALNCFYTNLPPSQVLKTANGCFVYNGIDRIDRNKGYFIDNCVPCNGRINEMKMGDTYESFITMCLLVVQHSNNHNQSELINNLKAVK